ncbi:MAG: hypothetical protein EP330_00475 [Deltaproteobacteria bacterium]|nr:MAG: hypothetical protein EP330_00475 [Deltaproteobacteria bacterium]
MLILLTLAALAEIPDSVRPIAATPEALVQFKEWSAREGHPDQLVCAPVVEEVLACFTVVAGGKKHWVGARDLEAWGVDRDVFVSTMRTRAGEALAVERTRLDEGVGYWVGAGDRWEMAGLLRPDQLVVRTVGAGKVFVGAPLEGTLLAWAPGDDELDHIMAVGVAEMTRKQVGAVSPVVLAWDGHWAVYGQAVAGDPPAPR